MQDTIDAIIHHLITISTHRRGKYAALSALVHRIGAARILDLCPNLLSNIMEAFERDSIRVAAASCLRVLLGALLAEYQHNEGMTL